MRTTVRLNNELHKRARREAARRGINLTAMIEQSLLAFLRKPPQKAPIRPQVTLPVCRGGGGTQRYVDVSDSATTLDRMEGRT